MSFAGDLIKSGILTDGKNITVEGNIRSSNLLTTRGKIWYVHSGVGSDVASRGKLATKPFATLDYAVGKCSASRGDIIYCLPGHTETIAAAAGLDLDVAGITVVFLGEGENKATITFTTAVTADMDVDADDITLINPRFLTGVDALVGPIDINAADFKIVNGEYHDVAAKAATDCIVAVPAAARLVIDGWKYFTSTTGTQKQSNIQLNGVDDATLKNIDIRGDFETGCVENVIDEVLNIRLENIILDNVDAAPSPCIVVDTNATGHAKNVKCRTASGTTYISQVGKINWASDCEGFSTDGYGGEPLGTAVGTGVEGKVDVIDGIVDTIASDIVILDPIIDTIASDLVVMDALIDGEVTKTATIASDLILVDTVVDTVASDLVVLDNIVDGEVTKTTTIASDLILVDTVVDTIASDLVVLDGIVDGEVTKTATIASDLILVDTVVDTVASDLILVDTVVDTVASDLILVDTVVDTIASDLVITQGIVGKIVSKAYADLTGYDDAVAFTVTGDVLVRIFGVVGATPIQSTSGTTTLTIGTTEDVDGIIAATTIDNGQLAATDVWVDATPTEDVDKMADGSWHVVGGGADITMFRSVDDITQGILALYCWWIPLSSDGNVVAA